MSREKDELGEKQHYEGLVGKGRFDPDLLGYPGEAKAKLKKAERKNRQLKRQQSDDILAEIKW